MKELLDVLLLILMFLGFILMAVGMLGLTIYILTDIYKMLSKNNGRG